MPQHRKRSRLDPRDPLVVDTAELSRRAGSLRPLRLTVPAPAHLSTEVIGVPEGADIELDLRLEAVMEGILVSGTARAPLTGTCSRCLDPVELTIEVDLQQLYVYPDVHADPRRRAEDEDDDDIGRVEGDRINLEPVLRDAVVLALPLSPRCAEDCPGLCAMCGVRLADEPADHGHAETDPRWAALVALRHNGTSDTDQES